MFEEVTVVSLKKTCSACPSQWEGVTADDREIYYRFRWGYLTVTVGKIGDHEKYAAVQGEEVFCAELSDGLDGTLSTKDMMTITKKKIRYSLPEEDVLAIQKYEDEDAEIQRENTEWFMEHIVNPRAHKVTK